MDSDLIGTLAGVDTQSNGANNSDQTGTRASAGTRSGGSTRSGSKNTSQNSTTTEGEKTVTTTQTPTSATVMVDAPSTNTVLTQEDQSVVLQFSLVVRF